MLAVLGIVMLFDVEGFEVRSLDQAAGGLRRERNDGLKVTGKGNRQGFEKACSGRKIDDRSVAKVKGRGAQFTLGWQSTNLAVFKLGPPLS